MFRLARLRESTQSSRSGTNKRLNRASNLGEDFNRRPKARVTCNANLTTSGSFATRPHRSNPELPIALESSIHLRLTSSESLIRKRPVSDPHAVIERERRRVCGGHQRQPAAIKGCYLSENPANYTSIDTAAARNATPEQAPRSSACRIWWGHQATGAVIALPRLQAVSSLA
jgi:hypothetical protein